MDWQKALEKAEKNVQKWSDKLRKVDYHNTSMRRRANLRIKLDNACKERDEIKEAVEYRKGLNRLSVHIEYDKEE